MKIYDTLRRTGAAVALSDFKGTELAATLKAAAIKAMTKGIGSDEWKDYMRIFADNEEQFLRLTDPDLEDSWLKESRAYIISNSLCGAATLTRTYLLVDKDRIDGALNDAVDPAFVEAKKFVIPEIG